MDGWWGEGDGEGEGRERDGPLSVEVVVEVVVGVANGEKNAKWKRPTLTSVNHAHELKQVVCVAVVVVDQQHADGPPERDRGAESRRRISRAMGRSADGVANC